MTTSRWRGPGWRLFDADPGCGKTLRDWIRDVVAAQPCPADPEDAAVVSAELFANAVMHGPPGGRVLAGYVLSQHGARIVMCDGGGATVPMLRESTGLDEGGRGLHIVDALSAQWGSFRAAQAQAVWCDLGQPLDVAAGEAWAWLTAVLADFPLAVDPDEDLIPAPQPVTGTGHAAGRNRRSRFAAGGLRDFVMLGADPACHVRFRRRQDRV